MSKSNLKNKRNKRIIKSRHQLSLREQLDNPIIEKEMREKMERSITEAFPNPVHRAFYISNLIKELEDEIARNDKEHKDE